MWISKQKYENLLNMVKNNEHDADKFRRLIEYAKENKTVIYSDFILVSYDKWNELTNKFNSEEDEVKDIKAELEWYKVKYHEMKVNAEQ